MKITIQDRLLPGENITKKFEIAKRLGLDGIELTFFSQKPTLEEKIDEISRAIDSTEIMPKTLCGGFRGWIGDFNEETRSTAIEDIGKAMKYCRQIGVTSMIAPAAYGMHSNYLPHTPKRAAEEDEKILLDSLKRIRESAEKYSVSLLLEPLNRYEDHMVNTLEQAATYVKKIGSPFINIMGDLFHMNIEEVDSALAIINNKKYLKHIHLADSNRLQPGKGQTDFKKIFQALKSIKFEGTMAFECTFIGNDRENDINMCVKYLKNLF